VVRVRGVTGGRRLRAAGEILAAGVDHLLLGLVEIVHPHAEMVDADLLVALLLEQRDVDGAVGDVEPAPGLARDLHVEGLLEELGGLLRVRNDQRDMAKLGHGYVSLLVWRWRSIARKCASLQAAPPDIVGGTRISGDLMYKDLREFIERVDKLGAWRRVEGADPRFEIGGITEVAAGRPDCPALLFDAIKGFPRGFRIFTNAVSNPQRAALALGIDPALRPLDALKAWMEKRKLLQSHEPVAVKDAAFLQNTLTGSAVDVGKFPAPIWHRHDGGPFIGSGSIVIMREPDGGWINASIYRIQVHEKNQVTVQFDHAGRHGAIIARKYWEQGKPCPLAIVHGQDPALFIAGFEYLPAGQSEYAFAGAIKGAPIEIVPGPQTGLPIPAHAEIVFEGQLLPEATLPEGPFGEFTGYYASEARPAPVMAVTAVYHRDDPILLGSPPMKPPRFHFG